MLQLDRMKRAGMSGNYRKKFQRLFLHSLNMLLSGIRIVFDPDSMTGSNITQEQIALYILDKKEGLGRKYVFNSKGRYAFANRLKDMSRQELLAIERLLLHPERQTRASNTGWLEFGRGQSPRILAQRNVLGKSAAFYLFKVAEHRDYENQLNLLPSKASFAPV